MSRPRLLLLLLVLLGFAGLYAWQQTPRQQRIAPGTEPAGSPTTQAINVEKEDSLDFSAGESSVFRKPNRDLFATIYPAPVVKKVPPRPKPKPVAKPLPKPKPKPKPVVKPVASSLKPIPPLTVLGYLEKDSLKTVFLASRQGEVFLVKQGDRFAEDLLVKKIDVTSIVISRDKNDKGVTLPIAENINQRMSVPNIPSGRPKVPAFDTRVPKTSNPSIPANNPFKQIQKKKLNGE